MIQERLLRTLSGRGNRRVGLRWDGMGGEEQSDWWVGRGRTDVVGAIETTAKKRTRLKRSCEIARWAKRSGIPTIQPLNVTARYQPESCHCWTLITLGLALGVMPACYDGGYKP